MVSKSTAIKPVGFHILRYEKKRMQKKVQLGFLGCSNLTKAERKKRESRVRTGWNSGKDEHSGDEKLGAAPSPAPIGYSQSLSLLAPVKGDRQHPPAMGFG